MTFRLIGLMSFVLLLCLGAVAFLFNQYQSEVMEEVAQTVSNVGRQTLRSLELPSPHDVDSVPADDAVAARLRHAAAAADAAEPGGGAASQPHLQGRWEGVVMFTRGGSAPAPAAGEDRALCEIDPAAGDALQELLPEHLGTLPSSHQVVVEAKVRGPLRERLFIQVEDIRTEGDFEGMMLRIPTWIQNENDFVEAAADGGAADGTPGAPGAGAIQQLHQKAFMLPINTKDFQELFSAFRRRSILLLLGVFLLGTVLSASLASRFTRPVRRLDAGIRRLAQGDLEVEVETRGRDEIARLGRAFNEMTRRLRSGREREREFRRREKLSALGRLAAGVAHDVRNPLHSINLTLQHLQETCRPRALDRGAEFDRSLAIIREEIRRLGGLVENFLRFARSDRREKAPLQVANLLRETAQLVDKEAARRRVEIEVYIEEPLPEVVADAESVRSSILNLVLNSFEAMPEGGRLVLAARRDRDDLVLEVIDSGAGIPAEEQDRVFDFAYTTRENGHGLGLPMVHQVVVEDHGGRITLESEPGAGTKVRLAFPLPQSPVPA